MILTLLGTCAALAFVGGIGAARKESWGLFFLFPALGAIAAAPIIGGANIPTMMAVEFVSGSAIRNAYTTEAYWSAAIMVGMGLGVLFAVVAVVAGSKQAAA